MSAGIERPRTPAEGFARGGDVFRVGARFPVHGRRSLFGRTEANDGPGANQRGFVGDGSRRGQRRGDGGAILAVELGNHMPAVSLEAFGGIVAEPADDLAVDGDAIVIVNCNQLA